MLVWLGVQEFGQNGWDWEMVGRVGFEPTTT